MDSFIRSTFRAIESFRLSHVWCNRVTDKIPANALLCFALTCNIRELYLKTTRYNEVELPPVLFTCKTFVVLKLNSEFVIDVLDNVSLPNLKTLVLKHVICLDEDSVPKLLSGCPVLEELQLRRDKRGYRKVLVYDVSHPTMKRFDIGSDLVGCSLPSVVEARINIDKHRLHSNEELIDHGKKVLALLKSIANVKRLFLTHDYFISSLHVIAADLPKFCKLVLLEITSVSQNLPALLMGFLESSPKLEVLSLPWGFLFDRFVLETESGWHKPQHVPECLFHSIKSVRIGIFFGKEDEINIVEYFLENAMKLEKMTIFRNHSPASIEFAELQRELKNHPHGSSNCQLVILHY